MNLESLKGAKTLFLSSSLKTEHSGRRVTRGSSSRVSITMTDIASFVSRIWHRTAPPHCHCQKHNSEACCCCFKVRGQTGVRTRSSETHGWAKGGKGVSGREHSTKEREKGKWKSSYIVTKRNTQLGQREKGKEENADGEQTWRKESEGIHGEEKKHTR